MTDVRSCPVAVTVHEGNVPDSKTFLPEVERLRNEFGIEDVVLVGDRGMIGKATIERLRERPGMEQA
jgi:transposase